MKINAIQFSAASRMPIVGAVDEKGHSGPYMLAVGKIRPLKMRVLDEAAYVKDGHWVLHDGEPVGNAMHKGEVVCGWAAWPEVVA